MSRFNHSLKGRVKRGTRKGRRPSRISGGAKDPLLDLAVQPAEVASDLDRVGEPVLTTDILAVGGVEAGVGDGELQEPPGLRTRKTSARTRPVSGMSMRLINAVAKSKLASSKGRFAAPATS